MDPEGAFDKIVYVRRLAETIDGTQYHLIDINQIVIFHHQPHNKEVDALNEDHRQQLKYHLLFHLEIIIHCSIRTHRPLPILGYDETRSNTSESRIAQ